VSSDSGIVTAWQPSFSLVRGPFSYSHHYRPLGLLGGSRLSEQAFDLAGVDVVVNMHLHFDHCGGNHLFAGRPIYVQRQELEDARTEDDFTIREWVEAPGVRYEPVDGELELLPGLRLVPAPGHTRGLQVVVVETGGRPVVVGGDVAVRFGELDEPRTEGQLRVRALEPELVWLAHEHEPWRPRIM
jgi:N-acyl homoserine lactone hydrolase